MFQWLGFHASTAEAIGSMPGQEPRSQMPHGMAKKKKKKKITDHIII